MLALTDQGLAHLCIAASAVPTEERRKWLRRMARQLDPSNQNRYYRRHRAGRVKAHAPPTSAALHDEINVQTGSPLWAAQTRKV